jgi:PKD repeat protein
MKNKSIYFGLIFFVTAVFFVSSCTEETPPPPTASFTATVKGNVVSFTAEATDYTKFEWNFNDGSYINTIPNPVHTFPEYGKDFTVTLTVLGEGGEVSVTTVVSIPVMTKMQLLTGGTDAEPGSKKWKLNPEASFFDVTDANENLTSVIPVEYRFGGALAAVGLGQVFMDEFEFKSDGSMNIISKGGGIFSSMAYCIDNNIPMVGYYEDLGLAYTESFTNPAAATFTFNESKDHTISTPYGPVTYPDVMTLSFTDGGFLGIMGYTT